ncbi:MAG: two-component sensor histidine kinase [Phyllobacteriaceae bacterium]|nr:two-component sensor histidine kinase [Phyllobacteriaceae bacterium]
MTRLFRSFAPRRIAAQLVLVVIASALLIQIIAAASFFLLRPLEHENLVHIDALIRFVADLPAGTVRHERLAELRHAFPELGLDLAAAEPADAKPLAGVGRELRPFGPLLDDVEPWVTAIRMIEGKGATPKLAVGLPGGEWLLVTLTMPDFRPPPPFAVPLFAVIAFALISSGLLAVWAARGLVRPLRALAAAARDFDIERDPSPLADDGPEEVQVASRAFDGMRRRIRDLVEDRTRMLAAMGHDLRTPITRLRLRSEFVGDETLKAEFLRDLGMMSDMVEGALTYLREGRHAEKPALVDLSALIGTVCDGAADLGRDVAYEGPGHLARRVRPQALTRALTNLVDNALKYAERARVRLTPVETGYVIEIEDDGPGIPEADRQAMLRPFVRGDAARNLNQSQGFGLGLAIARASVEGHGGTLTLARSALGGLSVRIELPDDVR